MGLSRHARPPALAPGTSFMAGCQRGSETIALWKIVRKFFHTVNHFFAAKYRFKISLRLKYLVAYSLPFEI